MSRLIAVLFMCFARKESSKLIVTLRDVRMTDVSVRKVSYDFESQLLESLLLMRASTLREDR